MTSEPDCMSNELSREGEGEGQGNYPEEPDDRFRYESRPFRDFRSGPTTTHDSASSASSDQHHGHSETMSMPPRPRRLPLNKEQRDAWRERNPAEYREWKHEQNVKNKRSARKKRRKGTRNNNNVWRQTDDGRRDGDNITGEHGDMARAPNGDWDGDGVVDQRPGAGYGPGCEQWQG